MMDIRLAKFFRIISIVMMQSVCENEIVYVFVEVEMQNLIKIVMMLSVFEIIETATGSDFNFAVVTSLWN